MINNRAQLDQYIAFCQSWNYRSTDKSLPEEIQQLGIIVDGKLLPRHCSSKVVNELYVEKLKNIQPAFSLDDFTTPTIEQISQCFINSGNFDLRPMSFSEFSSPIALEKGVMILGGIGTGKTLLMQGLIELYQFFSIKVKMVPTYELTARFAREGVNVFNTDGSNLNPTSDSLILDDLGAESIQSHYGQVTNVIAELMLRRYDSHAMTFGTSNLDQKTLRKFYGERVWSRMKMMFHFIVLKGNDRRQ